MLPVLVHFTFTSLWSQLVLYAVALAVVGASARGGWRGAPAPGERAGRAALHGAVAAALAVVGLQYALPPTAPLFGGRGAGVPLHTYGLLLMTGFMAAVAVSGRLAQLEWRRLGVVDGQLVDVEGPRKREAIMDLSFWVLAGGIGGSRLLFMLVNWGDTQRGLAAAFARLGRGQPVDFVHELLRFLFGGGLVFQGGFIGAALLVYVFARRHGLDFWRLADLVVPTVSLGAAFGRLGCFAAGCCWGGTAHPGSPLAVTFPGARLVRDLFGNPGDTASLAFQSQAADERWVLPATGELVSGATAGAVRISEWVAGTGHTLHVWPTQLFDSAGHLLLFLGVLALRPHRRFHGQLFALWLMAYAVQRTTVELFRGDLERGTLHGLLGSLSLPGLAGAVPLEAWYNVSTGQFISLCMFGFGAVLLYRKVRVLPRRDDPGVAAGPAAG